MYAHSGQGVDQLRTYLLAKTTPGEWVVEPGSCTDRSDEEVALELVRWVWCAACHPAFPPYASEQSPPPHLRLSLLIMLAPWPHHATRLQGTAVQAVLPGTAV